MSTQETSSDQVFQMVAGSPTLDFINALDWRFRDSGPEELLTSYADLLQFVEQAQLLNPELVRHLSATVTGDRAQRVLDAAKELRETLASIVYGSLHSKTPPAKAIVILERNFHEAFSRRSLFWRQSRLAWDWIYADSNAKLPLWALSLDAVELMSSDGITRVRACDNSECRWLFLDVSKSHTRRWCDMKLCGNRMKARRFKANRT